MKTRKFAIGQRVVITATVHHASDIIETGTKAIVIGFDDDREPGNYYVILGDVRPESGRVFSCVRFAPDELAAADDET